MIKACIFDLDGTIADTVESIAHAVNRVLEHFGLVPRPVEAFNFYAGDGFDLAVERALKDAGDAELNYLQEGIRLGRAWFNEDPLYHVKPYPNMRETLTALREEVPIAVCSNKPHEAAIHVVQATKVARSMRHGQTGFRPRVPGRGSAYLPFLKKRCRDFFFFCLLLGVYVAPILPAARDDSSQNNRKCRSP